MVRLLFGLESLFSMWMLLDAMQRGAARYWYPIIFLPFGQVAYFFMVKIHDPEFRVLRQFLEAFGKPRVTLEQLQYRAHQTPSFANKLAWAKGLFDAEKYQEAAAQFEALVHTDDESKDALYGYGLCQIELANYEMAARALQELIDIKPSFADYDAWPQLAFALSKQDKLDAAVAVLEELVRKAPRVPHRVVYASYLCKAGKPDQARAQLQQALRDHEYAPRFQRRQDSASAKKARLMLSQLQPS